MQTPAKHGGPIAETAVIRADGAALLPVDTAALFAAVRHTLLPKASKMGAQLTFLAGLPTLYGDRDLLESLLINLADNALNACSQHAQILIEAAAEGAAPFCACRTMAAA